MLFGCFEQEMRCASILFECVETSQVYPSASAVGIDVEIPHGITQY